MRSLKGTIGSAVAAVLLFSSAATAQAELTVTLGVSHDSATAAGSEVNRLTVDLEQPGVTIKALTNEPVTNLLRTTALSQKLSADGHYIVGSINGSFFHMNKPKHNPDNLKMPAYLLMKDGRINTYGAIQSGDSSEYMNIPSAFAVTADGRGHIGTFGYTGSFTALGQSTDITSVNKWIRSENEAILFTDSFSYQNTRQNKYGLEIVLDSFNRPIEDGYPLNTPVEAQVKEVRPGMDEPAVIPTGGAVLSIHGPEKEKFAGLKAGDTVALQVDLTAPWNNADFVLASGPLLVQNGRVDMTINPSSWRATVKTARTAVAVNRDGSEVFLVTVDSPGISLNEFAEHLVSIGAYQALNLDGGGSTTMAIRRPGTTYPSLVNRPSDGTERPVSSILSAISTIPAGEPAFMEATISNNQVAVGQTAKITIDSAMDANLHPVSKGAGDPLYSVEGGVGSITADGTFTATKPGRGSVIVKYGSAVKKLAVEVVPLPGNGMVEGFNAPGKWHAQSAQAVTDVSFDGSGRIKKEGAGALALKYDFSGKSGTSASYAVTDGVRLAARPERLGLWVFGDGAGHWLRGKVTDATGREHPINFTELGGLNWTGWKYTTAEIPKSAVAPVTLNSVYVAEPNDSNKNSGTIYFDRLIADYDGTHEEPLFNDVNDDYWAFTEIRTAVDRGWITGYGDGYFRPEQRLTRAHAAVMISRMLGQEAAPIREAPFPDVSRSHSYAREIAQMRQLGIMNGDPVTGRFNPNQLLDRAQMAAVLERTFGLEWSGEPVAISDMSDKHWAYGHVAALAQNGITTLYDGAYRPSEKVKRSHFAAFLYRADRLENNSN